MNKNNTGEDNCIDFIVTWVDDTDTEWQAQRNKYAGTNPEDLAEYRFRDWGTLKYLFRWIEKFTPWVNNVFFVTCGHYPNRLNLKHPKLKFIKHEDYIPKDNLPTFNANTIELNFHRIKELSEHFVYFNDDMFIINYMKRSDFFEKWFPKQIAGLSAIATDNEIFDNILLNDIHLINRHFSQKEVINKNRKKWFYPSYWPRALLKTLFLKNYPCFVWFANPHLPNSLLKSTMNKLWGNEYEILDDSSKTKFRDKNNVNQYVFSRYDIASGNFMPRKRNIGYCFTIKNNNKELINSIIKQKYKMICLNDTKNDFDFEKVKLEVIDAFEKILPEKSQFEK